MMVWNSHVYRPSLLRWSVSQLESSNFLAFANRFIILPSNIINNARFFFLQCYLMFWRFFEVAVVALVGVVGGEVGSNCDLGRVGVVLLSCFSFSFASFVLFFVSSHINSMLLSEQNKLILNNMKIAANINSYFADVVPSF